MYQVYKHGYTENKEAGVCIPFDYTYGSFLEEEMANKKFSEVLNAQLQCNEQQGLNPETHYDFELVQMKFKDKDGTETFIEIGICQPED